MYNKIFKMKKRILILISLICLNCISQGQTKIYHPFPDSSAMWITLCNGFEIGICSNSSTYLYGDTLINGITHHKLRNQHLYGGTDNLGNCNPNYGFVNDGYIGALREDTSKRIWFLPPKSIRDTLLYDFNLKLNDTLPNLYSGKYHSDSVTVKSIDSVLIGKKFRKRFNLQSRNKSPYNPLIEGIGSINGLLKGFATPFEAGCSLSCFEQNGKPLYPDASYACDTILPTAIKEIQKPINSINVFPNPATSIVTVKTSETKEYNLELVNLLGQVVYTHPNVSGQDFTFDVSTLAKGIYIVQLADIQNGNVGRQKLVVQ